MTTAEKQTYADAPTKVVATTDGLDYAYRDVGSGLVPLVLLQHFRGNLDNWDPALIDALASGRRVIAFDNAGVGGSKGVTPTPLGRWRPMLSPFSTRWSSTALTSWASRSAVSLRRTSP